MPHEPDFCEVNSVALPDASHATAAPAAEPVVVPGRRHAEAAVAIELLGGDEIIQVSLKPSLWFIPLISFTVLGAMAVIGAGAFAAASQARATGSGWASFCTLVAQTALLVAIVRVVFASLQWASRLYVLTNRRVMCFRGVLNVNVSECLLSRISQVDLLQKPHERFLRLGNVRMTRLNAASQPIEWSHLSRPSEIHELLIKAIRASQ